MFIVMPKLSNIDILVNILNVNPNVSHVKLVFFDGYALIQERMPDSNQTIEILNLALSIREKYRLPFWDSFNVSLFDKPLTDYSILNEILFHNRPRQEKIIHKTQLKEEFKANNGSYTTINSEVIMVDGTSAHLALLDFHAPVSEANEKLCCEIVQALGLKGYLLNSGKSYHFYGKKLLLLKEYILLLSKALLFSPIIDRAWISHQLIEESSCLRISPKYDRFPFLVTEID